jgi:hypothetical protein
VTTLVRTSIGCGHTDRTSSAVTVNLYGGQGERRVLSGADRLEICLKGRGVTSSRHIVNHLSEVASWL